VWLGVGVGWFSQLHALSLAVPGWLVGGRVWTCFDIPSHTPTAGLQHNNVGTDMAG